MAPLLVCLLLAAGIASAATASADDSWADHRAWLDRQWRDAATRNDPASRTAAIVWRAARCGEDPTCFPAERWRQWDAQAQKTSDPALLAMLANVAAAPGYEGNQADTRWRHIAELDPTNAYPEVQRAILLWRKGEREPMRAALAQANRKTRYDEYFRQTFSLIEQGIFAHPPTRGDLGPCAFAGDEVTAARGKAEMAAKTIFPVATDSVFSELGDLLKMCKPVASDADPPIRSLCDSVGRHMSERGTTFLERAFGLSIRRSAAADEAAKQTFTEQIAAARNDMTRQLGWVESPDSPVREEASRFWLDAIAAQGENRASAALISHFGEPPYEPSELREARFAKHRDEGRQCYAAHPKS